MTVNIIEAIDPNATNASSRQLAIVSLEIGKVNRTLTIGPLGELMKNLEIDTIEIEDQMSRVVISDEKSFSIAGALRAEISAVETTAEANRLRVGKPLRDLTSQLNTLWKVYTGRLGEAQCALDGKILAYNKIRKAAAEAAALAERQRIETEALALAAAAPKAAEEILQAGIEVAAQVKEAPAMAEAYGVKTNTQKVVYGLVVDTSALFIMLSTATPELVNEIIDFRKSGLTRLVKWAKGDNALDKDDIYAGVKYIETEAVRNY